MRYCKIIATTFLLVFLISILSGSAIAAYPDVEHSDWYYDAVTTMTEDGLIEGFPDGFFYPQKNINVAEFLKLIYMASYPDYLVSGEIADSSWGGMYYTAALDKGIMSAHDIGVNQLYQPICRYNAAMILSNVLENVLNENVSVPDGMEGYITDNSAIPTYYKSSVYKSYASGILGGYSDGSFKGDGGITRAEAAQMILRLKDKEKRLPLDTSRLNSTVEDNWFEDAIFIGDSLTHGLAVFGNLKTPDYYYSTGASLNNVGKTEFESPSGSKCSIYEAFSSQRYGKVYILLGINQLWGSVDSFYSNYCDLIDSVRELQPDADIYLQSILPVSQSKDASSTSFTKENVEAFNQAIRGVAEEKNTRFVDLYSIFADESGFLPEKATWDGVHLNASYYEIWADCLRNYT